MILGVEIGGTKLQLVTGRGTGEVIAEQRLAVDPQRGAQGIREQIQETIPALVQSSPLTAVGVGFGGPVDWRSGRICRSHQVTGWSEFPLGEWLHSITGVPVFVDNDANVATLGEAMFGAGAGKDPVFYVTLGSGVGGGFVMGGEIYHGRSPGEAEIGHVRLDRAGTIVEERCSGWAVDARIRSLKSGSSKLVQLAQAQSRPGGEARHLPTALAAGDSEAARILDEVAGDLAFALSHVSHLLHPAVIVLGGGLSLLGAPLSERVRQALPGFLMEAFRPGPEIALAGLGEAAVPVGALAMAGRRLQKA